MNATRHANGGGRGLSDAAVRGGLLIAVAVVIGVLLLWRAHDDSEATTGVVTGPTEAPGGGTTAPPGETVPDGSETTEPPDETTPTATTHAPADVPLLVANGAGTQRGAGIVTDKLVPLGYATKPAADADKLYPTSMVFYREGFAEDAKAVARALGVADPVDTIIDVMPEPPPVMGDRGKESAAAAQVLVLLGTDGVIK